MIMLYYCIFSFSVDSLMIWTWQFFVSLAMEKILLRNAKLVQTCTFNWDFNWPTSGKKFAGSNILRCTS